MSKRILSVSSIVLSLWFSNIVFSFNIFFSLNFLERHKVISQTSISQFLCDIRLFGCLSHTNSQFHCNIQNKRLPLAFFLILQMMAGVRMPRCFTFSRRRRHRRVIGSLLFVLYRISIVIFCKFEFWIICSFSDSKKIQWVEFTYCRAAALDPKWANVKFTFEILVVSIWFGFNSENCIYNVIFLM